LTMCPESVALLPVTDWAHLGTTTGSRLCPKDQPQQVRMPRVAELSENAWPRRAAAAGAPHIAAVRSRAFGGGIKIRPDRFEIAVAVCAGVAEGQCFRVAGEIRGGCAVIVGSGS